MTDRTKLSAQVRLDETGRVVLTDETLDALVASSDDGLSGGDGTINAGCTNAGDCRGSMNTSSCINSTACEGSMNASGECMREGGVDT